MKVNFTNQSYSSVPSFSSVYVTTSTKNNGDFVEKEVIKPFKPISERISKLEASQEFKSLIPDTNTFVLAAGSGSRFKELAQTQGELVNKISYSMILLNRNGIPTGKHLHMLDLPMAMASPMIDDKGLIRKNAEVAQGSFAEVVDEAKKLRQQGLEQKNVIVMCGDNLFDTDKNDPFELLRFCKDIINDPNQKMGLIGVEREPEEVINRFGVLKVEETDSDKIMKLDGFVEKPKTVDSALRFATEDGKCIANTGMFVIKKEAMEWLLDEIISQEEKPETKADPSKGFIARSAKEPYDFSAACEKVQAKYGKENCSVRIIDTWEDAGEPQALYRTLGEYQKGHFLSCLPEPMQQQIRYSAAKIYDGHTLLASEDAVNKYGSAQNATQALKGIKTVDGVTTVTHIDTNI